MIIIDFAGPRADVLTHVADLKIEASGELSRTATPKECAALKLGPGSRLLGDKLGLAPGVLERAQAYIAGELGASSAPHAGVTVRLHTNPTDAPDGQTIQVSISEYATP